MAEPLRWSDGIRSQQEGTDLASVVSRLSDDDVSFWLNRLGELSMPHETGILQAEADRRRLWAKGNLWQFLEEVSNG